MRFRPDGTEVDHDNNPVSICGPSCTNAAAVAAAVGAGYLIYRSVRLGLKNQSLAVETMAG